MSEYWRSVVEEALDRVGATLDADQIEVFAEMCAGAADVQRECCGDLLIPDPRDKEIARLTESLKNESSKRPCPACVGQGFVEETFGPLARVSRSQCGMCAGSGKVFR